MNAVTPGDSSTSAVTYERKLWRVRCETYTDRSGRRVGVAADRRLGVYGVAAELVAHGGDRLHRRAVVLARGEAGEQRRGDDVHRHRVVDRGLDGPAPLAGVLGVPGDLVEVGVLLDGRDQQVEQPG